MKAAAILLWVLALGLTASAGSVLAQGVTTSAISGTVTNQQGEPVPGVEVIATNTSTGIEARATTRSGGRYLLPGLQPGGPYRVEARGLGYGSRSRIGINLVLSQTEEISFTLAPEAVALEGITVVAEGTDEVISRGRTGTTTVIGDSTVSRTPTITRDFTDFTRLVPQVNVSGSGTSGAGRNNRFNNVQIDGVGNNDLFGLAASGTPGGQAGTKPISLEAIQEFQVVLAPFDVRQGGFTGLGINAITKSGTNDFTGSIAYFNRNDGLTGNYRLFNDETSPSLGDFSQQDLAGSFGGPIVRDRAFFFIAAEPNRRESPVNVVVGETTDEDDVTVAQVQEVANYLNGLGYDPGTIGGFGLRRESDNLFGRLDFNLGTDHRLTLRHNYVDAFDDNFSRSGGSYTLGNGGYVFTSTTNSSVAQLNSSFGRGYFNEFRLGFTTVREQREVGQAFPRITVEYPAGRVVAGADNFSGANALDQDILEITNDLTFSTGRHNLTLGTSNELAGFSNLFVRNPFGNYNFGSFEDLVAGRPDRFENSYLLPGGQERAEFDFRRFAFYAQDAWDATDDLRLTLGLRYDLTSLPTDPGDNPAVRELYGRNTSDVPNGRGLFNPRFGFNWDVTGDQNTQIRGGLGLFSGRALGVWVSNAYGNTGLDYVRFTCSGRPGTAGAPPRFVTDPNNQPTACGSGTASLVPNEINLVDPELDLPQIFRGSLAVDRRLAFGLVGTLEGLYTRTRHDLLYQNLGIVPTSAVVEGRPRYERRFPFGAGGIGDVIDVTNTDEGYGYNLTAQVQRPFRNGFDVSAAYTYSQAEDVNPLTSSQAISNWRFNLNRGDPNNPERAPANFEVPHRILATGSYQARLIPRAPTDISVVYVGQSGRPFSFAYNTDINFDGSFGNDLIYVPTDTSDPSQIRFSPETVNGQLVTPAQSAANLESFISSFDCLGDARGQIITRNACREPWNNRIDLRLAQNFSPLRGQNAQITLDIFNLGNLLNEEWGRDEFVGFNSFSLLVLDTRRGVNNSPDANGRRIYRAFTRDDSDSVFSIGNLGSRYQIQLGVRYEF
ncbi:MAG: TonB-dependent receptor [Gemmatimonadota bacterium]|nr:TonB-dependent receptor [Gemmatimonadota bacterium]